MVKTRIYELAKELGVDNKVIVTKAIELGMRGKSSHSSSLEPEEADQIRRAIIRRALGGGEKEVVTTRIDKFTGQAEAIVERRKGNVIRRRRQDTPAGQAEMEAHGVAVEERQLEEAPIAEVSEEVRQEVTPEAVAVEAIEQKVQEETPQEEAVEEAIAAEVTEEAEVRAEEPVSVVVEETVSPEVPPESAAPASIEEVAVPPVKETPKAVVETVAKTPLVTHIIKKVGPRVLGHIVLPVAKKPVVAAKKEDEAGKEVRFGAIRVAKPLHEEEEEEGKTGKKKVTLKKGRKREITRVDLVDYEGREARRSPKAGRGRRRDDEDMREVKNLELTKMKASKRVVKVADVITVGELARQMSLKASEAIAKLIELGVMATINQAIDFDTASLIAEEFDYQIERTGYDEVAMLHDLSPDSPEHLLPRPPVVTVMGHVDHGKTSLLDSIRSASVAAKEHGGITQHIGAYKVVLDDTRSITFLDTPGHAAFTAMRARGTKVTDLVVLVVAADDGVMPQTIEAINHAKAAKVPIIVAVNKMDKPEANPEKVKQQLVERGIQPEDWGGDTQFFPVSALKGAGIKELLEGILLRAEMLELRANPAKRAKGAVVEARQDKGLGAVATVLVQSGTLKVGDIFVSGCAFGRVRSMVDHTGTRLQEAGPSTPVQLTGLSELPKAGDDFQVVDEEAKSREVAEQRRQKLQARDNALMGGPISLEEFSKRANEMNAEEMRVILKADVQGSVEAVREAVEKLSTPKVKVNVIHAAVGAITESDVQLAIASRAVIFGFGVRAESRSQMEAEAHGIELRFYRIIYELIDDVKKAMAGMLAPIKQESHLGRADVREVFVISKGGTVAGCYITEGLMRRNSMARLLRDGKVVHEGKVSGLRRFKDDVREVQSGFECGISLENFGDIKVGDKIEAYEIKEVAATLD